MTALARNYSLTPTRRPTRKTAHIPTEMTRMPTAITPEQNPPMDSQAAIAKAYMPELARVYERYGEAATRGVISGMDTALAERAKALPGGGNYTIPDDWPDWNAIEAQLTGQAVAVDRVAKAEADEMIHLTPDGLARIVAGARAQSDDVSIQYDNFGETGRPVRLEGRNSTTEIQYEAGKPVRIRRRAR